MSTRDDHPPDEPQTAQVDPGDPPALIDTHAHLADERLAEQVERILDRAVARGVRAVITIGTTAADSTSAATLAGADPRVFAAVGIQPNYVAQAQTEDYERINELATRPRVVAIGETGLDRYWDHTPFVQQQEAFTWHLDLADRLGLPVVIHCRECESDIVEQLRALRRPVRGVLHSFSGTWADVERFLELGLHISFAGMITFPSKKLDALRDAAARVPLDRILVETDSPYLAPQSVRGKTNEPGNVAETAKFIARLRGIDDRDFAAATARNAATLFRLTEAN